MTDNSPETAKNSGVPNLTADEMAEAKRRKYAWALNDAEVISEARELLIELDTFNSMEFDSDAEVACQRSHGIILSLVERLETPSSKPAAWRWRDNEHQTWNFIDFDPVHMDYVYVEPLYAAPANSRAEAIRECVTALEADAEEFGKLARRELGNVCANARATILDCCDRLRSLIDKEGSK